MSDQSCDCTTEKQAQISVALGICVPSSERVAQHVRSVGDCLCPPEPHGHVVLVISVARKEEMC